MRIEVNETIEKELDEIKNRHYIYGKGHSETIAFLVRYHNEHKAIEKIIEEKLSEISAIIEKAFLKAVRTAVNNLLREAPQNG